MPRRERDMEIYKGDIFYIMKPQQHQTTGSEQEAGRPGIIVSNNKNNEHSDVVEIVYLTTREKTPLPTHVEVMCHVPSTALCEQILSVSKERIGNYIRTCTDAEMAAIDDALMISLGIKKHDEPNKQEDNDALIDELRNLVSEQEAKIEAQIVFERAFYKAQYELLLDSVIRKAVQA